MANIFIDPVIVMTPLDDASKEEVEAWLTNLEIWLHEALSSPFIWLHVLEVTNLLQAYGRFPNSIVLQNWQRRYQLDINPFQIGRKMAKFFRNQMFDLGENLNQLSFSAEIEKEFINILPSSFVSRWPNFIHDHLHLLLANTCACIHTEHGFAREMCIATAELADATKEINVSAVVSLLSETVDISNCHISHSFPLLLTPDDLLTLIDVIELWNEGESGIRYAIEQEYKKTWKRIVAKPLGFRFGPEFVESINNVELNTNKTVLYRIIRATSAVIAGKDQEISGLERHPLGITKGGPQQVRTEDNAKAWRLDIMKSGAGWRMHYWRIPSAEGDVIEFSNVQKESGKKIV